MTHEASGSAETRAAAAEPVLTPKILAAIREYFPRYPSRRAVILPALHVVNEQLGYVPPEAVVEIAQLLEIAPTEVYDTLSFYGLFKQDRPQGRVRAWVCRSISCAARGGEEILEYLCQRLGIRPGETTADGRVSLDFAECLGACDFAPAMLANDVLWKNLTRDKIDAFLETLDSLDGAARPR